MMKKREMASAIAKKWDKESKLNISIEWRINDLMKRYSWSALNSIYAKEIG